MRNIEKLFVNWVDGMKISREHFIAQEMAVRDHLRDVLMAGMDDHHYGLLEPPGLVVEGREARLISCRAICRDGSRIELLPAHEQHVICDLEPVLKDDTEGKSFYLLALLRPETREGVGSFVEEPPRQPVVTPGVSLQLLPVERLNAPALRSATLPLARFTVLKRTPVLSTDYQPPCFLIDGFNMPETIRKDLGTTLDLIVRNTVSVLGKLYSKPRDIQERFPNRCYTHWAVRSQLALPPLQAGNAMGFTRPYELVRAVVQLAFAMDGIWRSMPERAELMHHVEGIGNWASLIRAQQTSVEELAQLRYRHGDHAPALQLCHRFLDQTRQVYAQLGELDRFEPVTNLRDVAEETVKEIAPPEPAKPEPKGFRWVKKY